MDYAALDRLVKLRDSGAITGEEFASQKALLLETSEAEADGVQKDSFKTRAMAFLARAEGAYLAVLRGATLVFATILVVYAAWLGLSGLYNVSRNASAVVEEPVVVGAAEVAKADVGTPAIDAPEAAEPAQAFNAERNFYRSALDQYFNLYQTKFEASRKNDDKPLSKADFDKRFLNTDARITSLKANEFNFEQDKADVTSLIKVMTDVAALPETQKRLSSYKSAERTRVEEKINKSREERYCSYYGYYIDQCISYDTRQVNYTETKVSMKLPKGVVSHVDLFAAFHRKYLDTLLSRRAESKQKAKAERDAILEANARGKANLLTAVFVIGGFLALMFFFLLIAIERHQRKLASD
jgi:hypothetical protein